MTKAKELIKSIEELQSQKSNDVKTIQDINKQYNYSDEIPPNGNDQEYVACGQNRNYNELQNIYDTKLKKYVEEDKKFTEKKAIKALCETCAELESPRTRDDFYRMLGKRLNISIQK